MSERIGNLSFISEVVHQPSGRSMVEVACERLAYRRRNGSLYVVIEGRRQDLTQMPDGSLKLISYVQTLPIWAHGPPDPVLGYREP